MYPDRHESFARSNHFQKSWWMWNIVKITTCEVSSRLRWVAIACFFHFWQARAKSFKYSLIPPSPVFYEVKRTHKNNFDKLRTDTFRFIHNINATQHILLWYLVVSVFYKNVSFKLLIYLNKRKVHYRTYIDKEKKNSRNRYLNNKLLYILLSQMYKEKNI